MSEEQKQANGVLGSSNKHLREIKYKNIRTVADFARERRLLL